MRDVRSGADIDVAFAGIVGHEVDQRVGGVVDMQEFAPSACLSPRSQVQRSPLILASWALRISAGMTWLLLRSKLSPGPYRLVGIAEMKSQPNWRR